jgi:xeroderma pigmentosum group C-complementing protein
MPQKRRKAAASGQAAKKRRSTCGNQRGDDDIPVVFQEMLAEAVATSSAATPTETRAYIGRRPVSEEPAEFESEQEGVLPGKGKQRESPPRSQDSLQQIVKDDFDDSEDDDVEFEDVDLDETREAINDKPERQPLQLDLAAGNATPRRSIRRKLATATERRLRLDVHKVHTLLLLSAVRCRNFWCESEAVQGILKPLVSRKTISELHPPDSNSQADRTRSFNRGIEELCAVWRGLWRTTAQGMRKAVWRDNIDLTQELESAEEPIDFEAFKAAAKSRKGSRDLGAQLFCALLRSVAVDTRLVCSLQVLPFSAAAKGMTSEKQKPKSEYTYAAKQDYGSPSSTSRSKSSINDSLYPIFWVEVFSPTLSSWVPLDPLVRNTINKARTAFEPPASDALNSFSYVVAFEDDGSAKDVTLRYASHFNAKTRKIRIESTRGGEKWYERVMTYYEKPLPEVRDELEDADFLKKAEAEGMPKNVADFKGHPLYVLERHLRRNEVIHPRREVGKASVGAGDKKKLESVFRRRDVHFCRTADAWYRRGRVAREGMEPLKYATPRNRLEREELDPDDEENEAGLGLFADYQTELYVPPPVVNGRIPKNKFGNLDVYVDSMIPTGGVHVRHPLAAKAAQVLGISFADAVTRFEFKGRQGTAMIDGVVVAETQRVAMIAVIVGLQQQLAEEIEAERTRISLMVWKKWIHALQVRDKVNREYGPEKGKGKANDEGDEDSADETYDYDDNASEDSADGTYQEDFGGGFMPDPDNNAAAEASTALMNSTSSKKLNLPPLPEIPAYHEIVVVDSPHRPPQHAAIPARKAKVKAREPSLDETQEAGGFLPEHNETNMPTQPDRAGGFLSSANDAEMGGGFLPEDNHSDAAGRGFLPEEEVAPAPSTLIVPDFKHVLANTPILDEPNTAAPTESNIHSAPTAQVQDTSNDKQLPTNKADTNEEQEDAPPGSQQSLTSETSMLSHDPEEDDAEPEWLIDSLS